MNNINDIKDNKKEIKIKEEKTIIKKDSDQNNEKDKILDDKLQNIIIDNDKELLNNPEVIKLIEEQESLIKKLRIGTTDEKNKKNVYLSILKEELNQLKMKFSKIKEENELNEDENMISVIFVCEELDIEYSVVCKKTDILSEVFEYKLRKEKDALNEFTEYSFFSNRNNIEPNLSMDKNEIHDGDIIYLFQL